MKYANYFHIKKTVKYEDIDCLQSFLERKMPNINGNKNEMKIAKYKLTGEFI